jgi:hypothetical protein
VAVTGVLLEAGLGALFKQAGQARRRRVIAFQRVVFPDVFAVEPDAAEPIEIFVLFGSEPDFLRRFVHRVLRIHVQIAERLIDAQQRPRRVEQGKKRIGIILHAVVGEVLV